MNVKEEQINNKPPERQYNAGTLEKMVMGRPRRPLQDNANMCTPAGLGVPTSVGRSSSSKTRSESDNHGFESRTIAAICEGRGQARGTVGLAAIDLNKPTLIMCQIVDVQSYTNTLTKLNVLRPSTIIVPSSFVEAVPEVRLLTVLNERFRSATIAYVPRADFNSSRGQSQVSLLCAPEYSSALFNLKHKFYSVAAAAALLQYVERVQHVVYSSHSIRVEPQEPEDMAVIDVGTADRLELVTCRASSGFSLLSVLDHCVTPAGKRLLRATVLQPPCNRQVVESRLDCVDELLEQRTLLSQLRSALLALANVEQSVTLGSVMSHTAVTAEASERLLNYVLTLRGSLMAAATLQEVLASVKHPVLRDIQSRLAEAPRRALLNPIEALVNDDAHPARGHSGDMQRCFAIRAGFSDLLDVARRTYSELIDDMRSYVDRLAEQYSLPLRLAHNSKRGFHITLRLAGPYQSGQLPSEFVQVNRARTSLTTTTSDLVSYGLQLRNISQEIINLSATLLQGLLANLRPHVARLYQLCDDVALLDTLQSLAVASAVPGLVRPRFKPFMRLQAARHPLLERTCPDGPVANPALAQPKRNCHIITGPNMSGKSVYVRQLVLTQIMAQVGCYVPAEAATLRLCDRVYAIVNREDCIESGASSFVKEMLEVRYLIDTLTDNSLVVIDELCNATSSDEGTSLARAICEHLLRTKAFIFITTHYLRLTSLADEYPNVSNWHMETLERKLQSSDNVRQIFTHRLLPGVTPISDYGVKLALVCGSTKFVAERATLHLHTFSPAAPIGPPRKDRAQQVAQLQHELEADLELLDLENELTAERRQKAIAEFEQKAGQPYRPSEPAPALAKDTPSITSEQVQRVMLEDGSSTSTENVRRINLDATSDSCSEMYVNLSVTQPYNPSGSPGSSEWTLSENKNQSKTNSTTTQPDNILNLSRKKQDVTSTPTRNNLDVDLQSASSATFKLFGTGNTPKVQKCTMFDFDSKFNDLEKDSCFAANISTSTSTNKINSNNNSQTLSFVNVCRNDPKVDSIKRKNTKSNTVNKKFNFPTNKNKELNLSNSFLDNTKDFNLTKFSTPLSSNNSNRIQQKNFKSCKENKARDADNSFEFRKSNSFSNYSLCSNTKYDFSVSNSSGDNIVSSKIIPKKRRMGMTQPCSSKENEQKFVASVGPAEELLNITASFSPSPKRPHFSPSLTDSYEEWKYSEIKNNVTVDYKSFMTNINTQRSENNGASIDVIIQRTSTPICNFSSQSGFLMRDGKSDTSISKTGRSENLSSCSFSSTPTESDDKLDETTVTSLIARIDKLAVNDDKVTLAETVSKTVNADVEKLQAESNCKSVNNEGLDDDFHSIISNENILKYAVTPLQSSQSSISPQTEEEILNNSFCSQNSTIKLNLDGILDSTEVNSPSKIEFGSDSGSSASHNKKRKELDTDSSVVEFVTKRAKLSRRSSKRPVDAQEVLVAKRGEDGNFQIKMAANDSIEEIINKYLNSSD